MIGLPDPSDVHRFRAVVQRALGLVFDDTKTQLLAELLARRSAEQRAPVSAYLARLDTATPGSEEIRVLAEELTVCETYFHRHSEQLLAFAQSALPELLSARAHVGRLRLLSAGCASGEEPLSLAMILREHERAVGWAFDIRAVDVNRAALAKAGRGVYTRWSLRETPPEARQRWFRGVGREYEIDASIRAMVTFEERNLVAPDAGLLAAGSYDVVFCRNMLMYLDIEQARELVARLTRALVPGGFLFLGHAETLRGLSQEYHLHHSHGAFYYQRRLGAPAQRTAAPAALERVEAPLLGDPSVSWVEAIHLASQRVSELAARSQREAAVAAVVPPRPRAQLESAMALLEEERFAEALDSLRGMAPGDGPDADALLLRSALLAQSGALGEAEQACRELLRVDELNAGAHYVLALCREAAGDRADAAEHDRVAAYLDPDFAMPRMHLGLSARRAGDHASARIELTRAIDLLRREEPARILLFGGGFSRDALVALCRRELHACGGAS